MGKFTNTKSLSKKQQDELFIKFSKALAAIRNPIEAANFIRDLYSRQEALMLARRLQIAELLNQGQTYNQIFREMKVSHTTIAKVQTWLNLYGDGFRTLFKRAVKDKTRSEHPATWQKLKKKYPMYYWPELLLNEIIKNAGKKEKHRLLQVIQGMRDKTKLTKQLLTLLS